MRQIVFIVALSLAVPAGASSPPTIPRASRPRAERLDRWREQLERAEALRRGGDDHRAAEALRTVVDETAGSGGLLRARALDALADLLRENDDPRAAEPLYVEAAALWRGLLGPDQPRLAVTLHNLGVARMALGRWDDARDALHQALAVWEAGSESEAARAEATRSVLSVLARREAETAVRGSR